MTKTIRNSCRVNIELDDLLSDLMILISMIKCLHKDHFEIEYSNSDIASDMPDID